MFGLGLAVALIVCVIVGFALETKKPIRITSQMMLYVLVVFIVVALTFWFAKRAIINGEQLNGNIATSLGSIVVTVLVIDRLNAWRIFEQRKQEIFEEVQSPVRDVAVEAMRLIRKYNWLAEVLGNADLTSAQLAGADLNQVNLQGIQLQGADLQKALLIQADLRGSHLHGANLQCANLLLANLNGCVCQMKSEPDDQ